MRDGNPAERCVSAVLRGFDYLPASRRHEGGAGDHIAVLPWELQGANLLIETKGGHGPGEPWKNFTRADRKAMILTAARYNLIPLLAWVLHVGRQEICWLPQEDWPT